jgi:hypothetical protein
MLDYAGKAAPHSSRYYGRYGGEATKDYIAAQIGAAPSYSDFAPWTTFQYKPDVRRILRTISIGKRGFKMPSFEDIRRFNQSENPIKALRDAGYI